MNRVELLMRRRNVKAFIDADPIELVIVRPGTITKTAAGGKVHGPSSTLQKQTARIVLNKRRYNNGLINSEAGEIPHTDYLLVGMHTLNVQVDDTFKWRGSNYRVTGIYGARTESHLCSIDYFGPDNE